MGHRAPLPQVAPREEGAARFHDRAAGGRAATEVQEAVFDLSVVEPEPSLPEKPTGDGAERSARRSVPGNTPCALPNPARDLQAQCSSDPSRLKCLMSPLVEASWDATAPRPSSSGSMALASCFPSSTPI